MPYPIDINQNLTFTDGWLAVVRPRKRAVFSRIAYGIDKLRNAVANQYVAVEELGVTSSLPGAAHFTNSFSRPTNLVIASASNNRYKFCPGGEWLTVDWQLSGNNFVYQVCLELISNINTGGGGGLGSAVLWSRTITWAPGTCPAQGSFQFNGCLTNPGPVSPNPEVLGVTLTDVIAQNPGLAGAFPDQYLTSEFGPYKLKLSIQDPNGTLTLIAPQRALYFDVLVHHIELSWGPATTLAASPALFNTGVQRDRDVYNKLAVNNDPNNLNNTLPTAGQTKKVFLLSNDFYTNVNQQVDNTGYDRHLATWGFGPNIPLFVTPFVTRSDGQGASAPLALGHARFLWDWQDSGAGPDPGCFPHDTTYIQNAQNFRRAVVLADYPTGNNCHAERGGKRDEASTNPIFPPQMGYVPQAPLLANQFPFAVQAAAVRTWAGISTAWRTGDVNAAGKSGAIFSPSRMAGDAYTLNVTLFYPNGPNLDQAGVNYQNAYAAVPNTFKVSTGRFEVWREVEVAHVRKTNNLGRAPATQAGFDGFYQPAFLQIRLAPIANAVQAAYNLAIQTAVAGLPQYIQLAVDPGVDQFAINDDGVTFRTQAEFANAVNLVAGPMGGFANLAAGWAPFLDPATGNPTWNDNFYNNNAVGQPGYFSPAGPMLSWPRLILMAAVDNYFAGVDGALILEVNSICQTTGAANRNIGLRGFGIHLIVPDPNRAPIILCGDSPPETSAHELGHLLFLNHVHAQRGDRPRFHNNTNNGAGCVMSYVQGQRKFCGSCQLRLRGWSLFQVNNIGTGAYNATRTLWPIPEHNADPIAGGMGPAALPLPNPPY